MTFSYDLQYERGNLSFYGCEQILFAACNFLGFIAIKSLLGGSVGNSYAKLFIGMLIKCMQELASFGREVSKKQLGYVMVLSVLNWLH